MGTVVKIGELARTTGCNVETIRYYEKEGLLPRPARSQGNYRLYGAHHRDRLQFIRRCRSLDMSLDEIRCLLAFRDAPEGDCDAVNVLLDKHIAHVATRIAELEGLQGYLKDLRGRCQTVRSARDCGILHGLSNNEEI